MTLLDLDVRSDQPPLAHMTLTYCHRCRRDTEHEIRPVFARDVSGKLHDWSLVSWRCLHCGREDGGAINHADLRAIVRDFVTSAA